MRVVGFTIIRNALKYDFPIVEAIRSILPLCDEVVVAVGNSEDDTLSLIQNIDTQKVRIIQTIWDESLRVGGKVLAEETNKAFDAIDVNADWCVYIQGDEVMPEWCHQTVRRAMQENLHDNRVEGLLFEYKHFYGSYNFIGDSRRWYRREVRVVRNNKNIRSFKDAQGFRINGRKLQVKLIEAQIFHYGWVKPPEAQYQKRVSFVKLWSDTESAKKLETYETFDYSEIDSLLHYKGAHPLVMQQRIENVNWQFSFDPTQRKLSLKERLSRFVERASGRRLGEYKNYKIIS